MMPVQYGAEHWCVIVIVRLDNIDIVDTQQEFCEFVVALVGSRPKRSSSVRVRCVGQTAVVEQIPRYFVLSRSSRHVDCGPVWFHDAALQDDLDEMIVPSKRRQAQGQKAVGTHAVHLSSIVERRYRSLYSPCRAGFHCACQAISPGNLVVKIIGKTLPEESVGGNKSSEVPLGDETSYRKPDLRGQ